MKQNPDWVVIGRFGRPHGVKGYVTVHSFTEPRDNILEYFPWHGFINMQWQPLDVLQVENNNKAIICLIKDLEDRDLAATLTNIDIGIQREQLPSLNSGEYYWEELLGMTVVNKDNLTLGIVESIMPTGTNDVLVVNGAKQHLIPYLPGHFVLNVDKTHRQIQVDWSEDF